MGQGPTATSASTRLGTEHLGRARGGADATREAGSTRMMSAVLPMIAPQLVVPDGNRATRAGRDCCQERRDRLERVAATC